MACASRRARRTGAVALALAGPSLVAVQPVPAGGTEESPARAAEKVLRGRAPAALGERFGCLLVRLRGDRIQLRLVVTRRRALPAARRVARRARAGRYTVYGVTSPRLAYDRVSQLHENLDAARPSDWVAVVRGLTETGDPSVRLDCPGITIRVAEESPTYEADLSWARRQRERYGRDRITIHVVPPDPGPAPAP
jgi:hypothetical protein